MSARTPAPAARASRFATTRWSLVIAAGQGGSPEAEAALERLCVSYWYPVFAFVRRKGFSPEEAEDLTQGFFTRLIEKGDIADADRDRGRFRTFLLSSCQHFLANERDRAGALRRGGGHRHLAIDLLAGEGRYERSLSHDETPERLYERQWCLTLLSGAIDDVEARYAATGQARLFERLKGFLTAPDEEARHAEVAQDLAMAAGAVKVAIHRLRRRYREALRRRVADTVATPEEVDAEIRHIFRALTPGER